jgi:hypothetical protein
VGGRLLPVFLQFLFVNFSRLVKFIKHFEFLGELLCCFIIDNPLLYAAQFPHVFFCGLGVVPKIGIYYFFFFIGNFYPAPIDVKGTPLTHPGDQKELLVALVSILFILEDKNTSLCP